MRRLHNIDTHNNVTLVFRETYSRNEISQVSGASLPKHHDLLLKRFQQLGNKAESGRRQTSRISVRRNDSASSNINHIIRKRSRSRIMCFRLCAELCFRLFDQRGE